MQQEAEGLSLSSTLRPAGISAGRVQAESSSSFSADWAISCARLRGQLIATMTGTLEALQGREAN
ncbi:hypothetical protein [Bradyrhizobium sp.]|uniref:hypothetical protein n=1 Tax=Bradyrhizobium sp. TaxID=376 RepID=UPI002717BF35|nr:hypothetical protein [Bradyrhizobium sp.]MDO9295735.1 hypothetical protein [Bradyrhizobium sp.]